MFKKHLELKGIYLAIFLLFLVFLLMPLGLLFYTSFESGGSINLAHYADVFAKASFLGAFKNSFVIAGAAAFCTTILAFVLAYTIHYTNVSTRMKKLIRNIALVPMLLPTITYGFAIIYTFGKQGLLTKLLHVQLFDIYGPCGLLIGYVIYTLPIAFLLINNAMKYIDKKFIIVSKIMQDGQWKRFAMTILIPLIPTLAAAFLQSFFLSFTDFGIPAAVGGEFKVIATTLYNEMLGAIPNFQNGAVVAMMMLLPSILSVLLLNYLDRYQIRYHKVSQIEVALHRTRDFFYGICSGIICFSIVLIFAVIILLPFVKEWPYDTGFTLQHVRTTLTSGNLLTTYQNSLLIAIGSAILGTIISYGAALLTARSTLGNVPKKFIDALSNITNTIPGMVIGISFLFAFSSTSLQNTFILIILCNLIHFFSTPYVMAKNTLSKMNASYETTGMLMGDRWFKTIRRVVIPNSKSTILEMFSYYFINSMVTISALIFIVGAKTAVLTTKIKELQHFAKFDEIFVLSLLILLTNLLVKGIIVVLTKKKEEKERKQVRIRKYALLALSACILIFTFLFQSPQDKMIIYSNADEEALLAMRHALDENGFQDQYLLQSYGTSELGGKIMAEGKNIEADIITMSSYYIDSAQEQNAMFENLTFRTDTIKTTSAYATPLTALEGALIMNTQVLQDKNLPIPNALKDLTNEVYKGYISIPDIDASSTGWLLVQALIDTYGERIAKICELQQIAYIHVKQEYDKTPDQQIAEEMLRNHPDITHIAMIHSETTSGILNDISSIGELAHRYQKTFLVDAMSSFGGVDLHIKDCHIDFLISSANKCIQGVPGFSFIIANREKLIASKGVARCLSLDLYDQWYTMEKDGKWRYTSPTHVVLAFAKAMEELKAEGGIPARSKRYYRNMNILIEEFKKLGFRPYVDESLQGPIITTFLYPTNKTFDFNEMYHYIKDRGYAIYPGKLTDKDTFRIGTIGEIYEEDIRSLTQIMKDYMSVVA